MLEMRMSFHHCLVCLVTGRPRIKGTYIKGELSVVSITLVVIREPIFKATSDDELPHHLYCQPLHHGEGSLGAKVVVHKPKR